MYIGRDFDPADPGESEVYTLDFVNDLSTGEILATASAALSVSQGVDATPAARLIMTPAISGSRVMQRIAGLLPGVRYCYTVTVGTSQGNTLSLWSHIPCRAPI